MNTRVTVVLLAFLRAAPAHADPGSLAVEAYGDVLYSHHDYGPDQKSGPNGAPADSRATMDLAYLAAELEYFFRPDLSAEVEVEFEHGGTGSELELEYEEFGEYELDTEKGGEVILEQVHVTKEFAPSLRLRVGHFLTAVGLVNRSHRPTRFFTGSPAEAERSVIPTSWDETGAEVFGEWRFLAYRVQLVNALDSSGFSSKLWIVGGKQGRFELIRATDLAVVARLDATAIDGLVVGGAFYRGDTTENRPKPDMEGIDAPVTIGDVHATLDRGGWRGRALYLRGRLENADVVSSKNNRLSTNLLVSRTPVARGAFAAYAELGYDVATLGGKRDWKLYPFVHFGRYDTMAEVDPGIFADPRFDRTLIGGGLNVFPHGDVVVKLDFAHRSFGSDAIRAENTISLDVGFSTTLFERHDSATEDHDDDRS